MLVNIVNENGLSITNCAEGATTFGPEAIPILSISTPTRWIVPEELVVDRRSNLIHIAVTGHSRFVIELMESIRRFEKEEQGELLAHETKARIQLEEQLQIAQKYAQEMLACTQAERKAWKRWYATTAALWLFLTFVAWWTFYGP